MSDITALYYSHAEPPANVGPYCRRALRECLAGLPLIAVVDMVARVADEFGTPGICMSMYPESSGHRDITNRILVGLTYVDTEYVALCEHDVIYPAGYFTAALDVAKGTAEMWMYYGSAVHLTSIGWRAHMNYPRSRLLSCLTARRDDLVEFFTARAESIARGERVRVAEPTAGGVMYWSADEPVIDIRHGGNLTGDRTGKYIDSGGLRPLQAIELWKELGLEG